MSVWQGALVVMKRINTYLLSPTSTFSKSVKNNIGIGYQMNLEFTNSYYLYLPFVPSLICESAFRNIHVSTKPSQVGFEVSYRPTYLPT